MKLTKLEQSGFIIETKKGFKLALDIASLTPLDKLGEMKADAMLVSHLHGDHYSADHIKKISPKKVYLNEECIQLFGKNDSSMEIVKVKIGDSKDLGGGIKVSFFDVDHGPNTSVKPKENFGFLIEADGEKLYFGGDIFYPSGMDVSGLEVEYALIPVGTYYTFGPHEALDFIKKFKKIGKVVPMHYHMKPDTKGEFVKLAEKEGFKTEAFAV